MSAKRRLGQNLVASSNKLRLDRSLNKLVSKIEPGRSKKQRATLEKQASKVALTELLRSSPAKNLQKLPDFKTFLSDKDSVQEFREFLKSQFCHENIDFYLACEKFRSLREEKVGGELIKFMATQIYNDFLSENARQRVNINYDFLQNIKSQLRDPKPNMFYDSQLEIFELMKIDCFPRFCKTWRFDKERATKILSKNSLDLADNRSSHALDGTCYNNSANFESDLSSSIHTSSIQVSTKSSVASNSENDHSAQSRSTKRKYVSFDFDMKLGCPPNCPYYRIGLPCHQHASYSGSNEDKLTFHPGAATLRPYTMSNSHHCKSRRTPPPPPLPPKPEVSHNYGLLPSSTVNKKLCPYVGRAFDV